MKKTLLQASSNGFLNAIKKSALKGAFALLLFIASFQNANAQCIGPYQNFESVPSSAATMLADGWSVSSSTAFNFTPTATTQRTGRTVLLHSNSGTIDAAVITPLINTPANFSFYIRKSAGTISGNYTVDFSDDGGTTWFNIPAGTNSIAAVYNTISVTAVLPLAINGPYDKVSITAAFPATPQGYKFRVTDRRSLTQTGAMYLDDFSWTSSVAAENLTIVAEISSSTLCNFNIVPGRIYKFYDNGGKSDTYSPSQAGQQMSFTPTAGKIKMTREFFSTEVTNDYLEIYNSDNLTSLVATQSGNLGIGGYTITSTAGNGALSTRFVSNAGLPTSAQYGYEFTVEAVDCNTPNTLAGVGTFNQANLTWVGSAAASEYEVFQATSATPVPTILSVGTLTGSTTASYNATGLTPGTTYYFWVRSVCGASKSDWAGPIAVTPICSAVNVPYLEDFNGLTGGALPACTSANDPSWASNNINGNLFSNAEYTSFFTKGVNLVAGTTYRLSYDFRSFGTAGSLSNMEVSIGRVANNSAPTEVNLTSLQLMSDRLNITTVIQTSIENFTVPVSGVYYVRFFLLDTSNPGSVALNLDNINVEVETCFPPLIDNNYVGPNTTSISPFLNPASVTDFSASISWNAPLAGVPSNGYFYYISTTNIPPAYTAAPSGTSATNSITLTGLSPNTRYFVWTRGNCGAQISNWSLNFVQFVTTNVTSPVTVLISDVEPVPASGTTLALNRGCNFNFSDSGGATGNYSNNENHTYTFTPALGSPAGTKLKVVFSSFNVENSWDGLLIFNGDDSPGNTRSLISSGLPAGIVASCPAGSYRGTTSPGTLISNAANGSLSFTFTSDGSVTPAGWTATITCVIVPTISSFSPTNNVCGSPGTVVTIIGTNFTGATGVLFGGIPATVFSVNGAGTQISATVPPNANTGTIRVTNANAFGDSVGTFTFQPAPPTTTNVEVCVGTASGVATTMTATGTCNGTAVTTFAGSLTAGSLTATRPNTGTNCNLSTFATSAFYTATQFTVSVTGVYQFETFNGGIDFFAYITSGPFVPGSCATGTMIQADDDSGAGLQPQLNVTLTAGVVYTLYTTTFGNGVTGSYTWNITPPSGGGIQLAGTGVIQWYTVPTLGTPLATGSNFNPVGIDPLVPNTASPVSRTYYVTCSSNSTCRTPTTFIIVNPGTIAPATQTISCTGSVAPLVLTGSSSTISKWQYNATDATFASGVTVNIPASAGITTLSAVQIGTFTGTRYYRAETTVGSCISYSNTASITFDRAIWNGASWSSVPTATTAVEFAGNYSSTGNLSACSVTVTSGNVVFNTGHTLSVQSTVTVTSPGTLTFEDESSLLQTNPATNAVGVYNGGNVGNITYRRTAEPMFKMDYTYWSTPVSGQNLLALSSSSPQNYFLDYTGTAWNYLNASTTTMRPAKGYLVRAPLGFPVGPIPGPSTFTADFNGVPNNGAISIPVIGGASQLNLIGNPYPSALSAFPLSAGQPATGFVTANPNLNGSLYFWTHNTPFGVFAMGQYNPNDYAIYNFSGASIPSPTSGVGNTSAPNGLIASGQGFFVEGLAGATTANFTNAMRRAGSNNNFYRSSQENQSVENGLEKHRYWIDIINNNNDFKQVLIGYIEGATNGLDRLYDAKMVDINSKVAIYTKVENTHLTIQGKALGFDVNEQIPLFFKTAAADTYTISLSNFDGLFLNQNVYLEDKVLNVIHNLKDGAYTFASNAGLFENRFVLRYTTTALGVNDTIFNDNSVIVYKNESGLVVNTGIVAMKNVTVYDITGREIASKTKVNNVITTFTNLPKAQQVLLVKIESEEGAIVTKKIIF